MTETNKVRRLSRRAAPAEGPVLVAANSAEAPVHDAPEPETPAGEAASAPPAAQTLAAPPARKGGRVRKLLVGLVALGALAGAGHFGYDYYTTGRFIVSTDDAYVTGDIATISPKVSGYVAAVNVVANQMVHAGDPLVTLDDGDYRIARDQAQAQIDTQTLTLGRIDAQIAGAEAAVAQAEAQVAALEAAQRNAQLALDRATALVAKNVVSQSELDRATAALDQANANLAAAQAQVTSAQANIAVLKAQRGEAESVIKTYALTLEKAQRDLDFTVLRAPYDGIVGNLAVQKGNLVGPSSRLAAIVPTQALYIEANFKETQLAELVPGETVTIRVDALDAQTFTGTLASIAPASGSVFSLLPAENATGNFTKVVQRVPVRIALPEEALASGQFRAGLSVVVGVDTRTAPAG